MSNKTPAKNGRNKRPSEPPPEPPVVPRLPPMGTLRRRDSSAVSSWPREEFQDLPQTSGSAMAGNGGIPGNIAENVEVGVDSFFRSKLVMSLNIFNFDAFVTNKEKALVMFYNSRKPESVCLSKEFDNAAVRSRRVNHAFASVDCSVDMELCCREKVNQMPVLKLYSNGFGVSKMEDLAKMTADQINMLLVMTPVLTEPRAKVEMKQLI